MNPKSKQTNPTQTTLQPPVPPTGRRVVVVTDLDRTFTRQDLSLAPDALQRAKTLRNQGFTTILVTGRHVAELPMHQLRQAFDAFVMEGGAVWGKPGHWTTHPCNGGFWTVAEDLAEAGHDVRQGWASFSVPSQAAHFLDDQAMALNHNGDRVDVTPIGVDKGTGMRHALASLDRQDAWTLAVGDGDNDIPMFRIADMGVAVANASPGLQSVAARRAPQAAHRGFLWAVSKLTAPSGAPEAALELA